MISLFIDTSSKLVSVSIVKDSVILNEFKKNVDSDIASKIMPIIDKLFNESKINPKDINKIFVVNGPGSFTGIRIGVTIAKTMAWALGINVVPISSLEYLASTNSNNKLVVPLIDARRGNVFAGAYDSKLNALCDDKLVSLDEILRYDNSEYLFVSNDEIKGLVVEKPVTDVLRVINKHLDDEGVNAHALRPEYLKLTEAEENRLKND